MYIWNPAYLLVIGLYSIRICHKSDKEMSDISLNDVGVWFWSVLLPLVNISLIIPFPSQNFWVRRGRGVQCSHERGTLILIKVNIVGFLVRSNIKRAYLIWFRHRMTPRCAGPSRLAVTISRLRNWCSSLDKVRHTSWLDWRHTS